MGISAVATFGFGVLVSEDAFDEGQYPWEGMGFEEWVIDKYGFGHALREALFHARSVARPLPGASESVIAALKEAKKEGQDAFAAWQDRKKELMAEAGVSFEYGGSDGYQAGCLVVVGSAHQTDWSSVVEAPPDTSFSATAEYARIFQAFSEKVGLGEFDLGEPGWLHCAGMF